MGDIETEKASTSESESSENTDTEPKKDQKPSGPIRYPSDLGQGAGKTYVRFATIDRMDVDKPMTPIYLYAPPGLAISDGVGYHALDMGSIGGLFENFQEGSAGADKTWLDGLRATMNEADVKALGKLSLGALGKGIGQRWLMKEGIARNPFTVQQFSGVQPRSFGFSFKLVAENSKQADTLKHIENTFRKFLYPSVGASDMQLKYPPYWKIEFYNGEKRNKHLPFINLSYLQSMSATYNQSSNAFHKDGRPLEVDIALTFQESKNMTREDLYDKDSLEYTYNYVGSVQATEVGDTVAETAKNVGGGIVDEFKALAGGPPS